MISADWKPEGWMETGTKASAYIRDGKGIGRLWINDELVVETSGGEFNTRTEWDDERAGIVDLAVVLCLEAFDRGQVDLSHHIMGGLNTATVTEDKSATELPASVMYESWKMVKDLEAGRELIRESIEELQLDMFRTPDVGPQLELFG